MNQTREKMMVRRSNALLAEAFGRASNQKPRVKWEHTHNLFLFEHTGYAPQRTPNGVFLLSVATFDRYPWSDIMGPLYVLCKLKTWTREEWDLNYGSDWPYPENGEYEMMANWQCHPNVVPDEDLTRATIEAIRRTRDSMGKQNPVQFQREQIERALLAEQTAFQKKVDAFVEDKAFAFNSVPGTKGATSFPLTKEG